MAVLAGKLEARREDCAPVAGKSTLNRLEAAADGAYVLSQDQPQSRWPIKRLLVDLFLEGERASAERDHP